MAEREDLSGRTLGEFVLRARIDEGGFGAVYRCDQPLLGREAVVKVLHQRLRRNDVVLQRFVREAQLASRLDHPYAAHVYAFGIEHEDGLFWIAMEMVQGTALNRWLSERGSLQLEQLVPLFESIAEVVHTAHERGIVHRDLKPSNVMVIERAGRLMPKLLDFGVAKLVDPSAYAPLVATGTGTSVQRAATDDDEPVETTTQLRRRPHASEVTTLTSNTPPPQRSDLRNRLTHADSTIGSPPYMSPEQWSNAITVGPGSDLYALAVVAYEALTGRRPFVATTVAEYAEMHCSAPVPPLGDGFSPDLDRFFARALAKRPEDRFASALELAAALRAASGLGGGPAELPRLDDDVRDEWLTNAPQPLAELVAALVVARNAHQARDAAHDLLRGVLRYLLALALATHAQVRDDRDDPALLELVRAMRQRELSASERVRLIRLLVSPLAGRRGAHPIPELVDLIAPDADDGGDGLDLLLAMQPASDQSGAEDMVRSWLGQLVPELTRVLQRLAFVLDYTLIVPRDEAAERWTGSRRARRALATVQSGELMMQHPMLLDHKGRVCVDLWPLVQLVPPTEGADPELFVFDGRGRHGARMIAAPRGYEHDDPEVWSWIAANAIAEVTDVPTLDGELGPPYLGLVPYSSTSASRFIGREVEVEALLRRLRHRPLQIVVGASGSGKTSFIHAGVVPRLPTGWRAVSLRAGAAPLAALAARLSDAGAASGDLPALLAASPTEVAARVAAAAGTGTVVIVIDQLEELFTLCGSTAEREQFAAAIAQLAASPDLPVRVIAAIREDSLAQLDALPALRALVSPSLVALGNPTRDDLIRILAESARRAGYSFSDPDLAADMVSAVTDRPGAVSLLSYTAYRLWQLRDRTFRQLTRSAYGAMSGVAGALVSHAETTFEGLAADEQRLAHEIFRHLVTADGTRAHLSAAELRQRLGSSRGASLLDKLVAARLITTSVAGDGGDADGDSVVEVSHDALLEAWPRLQRWLREDLDGARMREQLRVAARQWHDRGRSRGLLWRDDVLADLRRWLRRSSSTALSDLEAAFVQASLRLERRARIRRTVGLIVIGFSIAFAVFFYSWMQSTAARHAAEAKVTQSYADHGQDALLQGKSVEALIYLDQAAHRGDDSSRVKFMMARAIHPFQGEVARLAASRGRMWWAEFSRDGKFIATTDDAGAQLWDARTFRQLRQFVHHDTVYRSLITVDDKQLITASADGSVKIWNIGTGDLEADLRGLRQGSVAYVTLASSPDGVLLAAADYKSGNVDVWDLHSHAHVVTLNNEGPVTESPVIEFSRDGRWFAMLSNGGASVFDAHNWTKLRSIPGPAITSLAIDPAGARFATASRLGDVSVWDIVTGDRVFHLRERGDRVHRLAFASNGAYIAAAGQDGVDRVWNARNGEVHVELKNHRSPTSWTEFALNSNLLVSADIDGVVTVSDVALGVTIASFDAAARLTLAVHFDPTAHSVIGASIDGKTHIWSAASSYLAWASPPLQTRCVNVIPPDADRRYLAIACDDHRTRIWDTAKDAMLAELPGPLSVERDQAATGPVVSQDGHLAAIAVKSVVHVHELPDGGVARAVEHPSAVTAVAFSPAGNELVSGSKDGTLLIAQSDGQQTLLARSTAAVDAVAWLANGRIAVADASPRLVIYDASRRTKIAEEALQTRISAFRSSVDGHRVLLIPVTGSTLPIELWDAEQNRSIARLDCHALVFAARFVSDDRQVLTASNDGSARLWDAVTGRLRKAFLHASSVLFDATLDPTGTLVVTAGFDGVVGFWDVASSRLLWTMRTHSSPLTGIHFEAGDLVTRAQHGEVGRWIVSSPTDPMRAAQRVRGCLPMRFDTETDGLIEQPPSCDLH